MNIETETVERLRASRLRAQEEDKQEGHAAGARWAKYRAEYTDLRRLANTSDEQSLDWETLPMVAAPDEDPRDFWAWVNDGTETSEDFCNSFVEGALEVLEAFEAAA